MCMSPSQLMLATHTQLSSQLLAPINNAAYVYIAHIPMYINTYVCVVLKLASKPIPRPCHAHKVDTSPAFYKYHAEEIGYTTTIIFDWEVFSQTLAHGNSTNEICHRNRGRM